MLEAAAEEITIVAPIAKENTAAASAI